MIKEAIKVIENEGLKYKTILTTDVIKLLKRIDEYHEAELEKLRLANVIKSVCEHNETENIHCEVGWSIEGKRCKKCKQTVL